MKNKESIKPIDILIPILFFATIYVFNLYMWGKECNHHMNKEIISCGSKLK